LYSAGKYLTDEKVQGKYSEDMFYDFASNFIDSNLNKPFLIFYSFNLVQKPWVPTPDNPEFAAWDPSTDDDTKANKDYYPEMISYLDKNVGKLINKVQSSGLANNTVIIFTSDNATNNSISSIYKGESVNGTKGTTTFDGTNVPLLIYAQV
jgi:arylsulfatase A